MGPYELYKYLEKVRTLLFETYTQEQLDSMLKYFSNFVYNAKVDYNKAFRDFVNTITEASHNKVVHIGSHVEAYIVYRFDNRALNPEEFFEDIGIAYEAKEAIRKELEKRESC